MRTLTVLGAVAALSLVGGQMSPKAAHAASPTFLRYQRGLYVDHGWLCRGWPSGVYHCTRYWHVSRTGQLVSDNQRWVPTGRGAGTRHVTWTPRRTVAAHGTRTVQRTYFSPAPIQGFGPISPTPANLGQWNYTGRPAYAMSDYRGDPYASSFGWCTWWAQYTRMDEPLMRLGNAWQWAYNAPRYGLRVGSRPAVGATVIFQPGVQGASHLGHAGHVVAVYANGWFLESSMSAYINGGGWGRVSFLYAHAGPGVMFIY